MHSKQNSQLYYITSLYTLVMNRGVDVAQSVAAEAVERDRESIKNSDIEAAHPELDQGIGVTKIEALCEFGFAASGADPQTMCLATAGDCGCSGALSPSLRTCTRCRKRPPGLVSTERSSGMQI